ncbi:MAG: hypothetical protein QXW97_02710 [Candidatus Pacearchaeota archaeon]
MIIESKNLNEIRAKIQKIKKQNPEEIIIVKAGDENFNDKLLKMKEINIILSPEIHDRKDRLKQRDSGLNEYLCKLAKKNKILIAIDIDSLKELEKIEKAKALARIKQNIQLCKKTKTPIILFPKEKYSKLDALSLLKTLGGSTEQIKFIDK